jgi:PucR family transcriptional regulator, purine catabolism regulatory protein
VLGPILAYDEEHATELLRSLALFLDENRSWQRSAELLHVHKQTLVYRMHRVEELTGRDLRRTADVVELWLALRALEFSRDAGPADPPEVS